MLSKKAQSATQLIVIFIIGSLAIITTEQYVGSKLEDIRALEAKDAIASLGKAATEIYNAGGGVKTVRIIVPTSVVNTTVSNSTMVMTLMINNDLKDAVGKVNENIILVGGIPTKEGEHLVKVKGLTDRIIQIGEGYGVIICGENFYCGKVDGICPENYGAFCSEPDPDC